MDTPSTQNLKQEIKNHLLIYIALLLLTAVNFTISRFHLFGEQTVVGVIAIAIVQGALVAGCFMHLISEKKLIHFVLILTFIFFLGLLFLQVLEFWGRIFGSIHVS